MVVKSADLETVCGITSKLPDNLLPEIAFAGKSNVGKSSLINGLLNRKSLARTSASPGKTQTINFYNINQTLYFVDLPGYGYAKVSQEIRNKWGRMIERYLHASTQLKAVLLLIDISAVTGKVEGFEYWVLLVAGVLTLLCMLISGIGVRIFLHQERDEMLRMHKEQQLAFAREEDQKRLESTMKKIEDESESEKTE